MATEGTFAVPAGRRLSRVDSKTLRESFSGSASAEMEAVMRNIARKDDKIKYNRRMRVVLAAAVGVMVIMVGAMFAVTLSANEASKESHVTGGVMTSLNNEAVKTDAVKSYGNILGFPCLPMSVLQRMDEVSLEIKVPTDVATDGLLQVVLKVGTVERSVTDKFVMVKSPSDNQMLNVRNGMATYTDREVCKEGCEVIVTIDTATGRRLTQHTAPVDRSLTAEPPKTLATFATFNMFAKVYKEACGAMKTVGALCKATANPSYEIRALCRELGELELDQAIDCEIEGKTVGKFTMKEILQADDVQKAYKTVEARCVPGSGRQLREGRKLIVNYGWCSMKAGFILKLSGDTANYCAPSGSWRHGGKESLSRCCVVHDKCLQDGSKPTNGNCGVINCRGYTCDKNLSSCAWNADCRTGWSCGWRGCRFGWDFGCLAAKTMVAAAMGGVVPNSGHNTGGNDSHGCCRSRSGSC